MDSSKPYRPRTKRDPQVAALFWRGVYYALVAGLLVGIGLWGFLLLGGAPFVQDRARAVATLAVGGAFGALLACACAWGYLGLGMVGQELVRSLGARLQFLVLPFVGAGEDEKRAERAAESGRLLARALLAGPSGIPIMAALLAGGKVRSLGPVPLGLLSVMGAIVWLSVASQAWAWATRVPPPPPPPAVTQADRARQDRLAAEMDSSLQLAVARAKRAREDGDPVKAIELLEKALQTATAEGRSVAHLQLHWMLAWLYADQRNTDGAKVMFRTVLQLADPGSREEREAQAALGRLSGRTLPDTAGDAASSVLEEDLSANSEP